MSVMSSVSCSSIERKSAPPRPPCVDPSRPLHPRSFKLRFAPQRELGRSYVSLVKPFGLPATVRDKFYVRGEEQVTVRALRHIQDMVSRGPRQKYDAPVTSAHQYGWWWDRITTLEEVPRSDRRLHHHIQDSQWLKERLRVLAADDKLKLK